MLPHLIACVEAQGAEAAAIRRLPGLVRLDDPDARVAEETMESAWRLAAMATRDPAIGIHVAESLPRGALDLVEYAFRSSPSLGSGLERLARYGRVVSDRVAARTEADGGGIRLLVGDVGTTALHPGRAEFALAAALKLSRDCSGATVAPLHVSFAHNQPDDISEHRRFFAAPLRFSGGLNSIIISAADAARPLREADPALSAIVRRRLDKVLVASDRPAGGSVAVRVRRMLLEDLGQAAVSVDAAAQALAMSRRTLTRRLSDEGTSFREIFDDVRAELARALLQDRRLSVADIAFFLQYSEPSAFHRSFRRWTGQTPQRYRKSA